MKFFKIFTCALILNSTAACSSGDEKICKESISKSLLNPESADFKEFKEIPLSAFWNSFDNLGEMLKEDIMKSGVMEKDLKSYSTRMQAQGRLGNTITSVKVCLSRPSGGGKRSCQCHDPA